MISDYAAKSWHQEFTACRAFDECNGGSRLNHSHTGLSHRFLTTSYTLRNRFMYGSSGLTYLFAWFACSDASEPCGGDAVVLADGFTSCEADRRF